MNDKLNVSGAIERSDVVPIVKRSACSCGNRFLIRRAWAMPSMHTYTIKPIAILLRKYGVGAGWIDPFAGENSPAEWTNDLNPVKPTKYHMDALDFLKILEGEYVGGLFDPPYSLHQIIECYEGVGLPLDKKWATTKFYTDVKNALTEKVQMGGLVISCGWNTIGMGKKRGFRLEEVLVVCHGRQHNDTLVTVERRVSKQERLPL
jgi:hypothetical protein